MTPAEILADLEPRLGALGGGGRLSRRGTGQSGRRSSGATNSSIGTRSGVPAPSPFRRRLRRRCSDVGRPRTDARRARAPRGQVARRGQRDRARQDALPAAGDRSEYARSCSPGRGAGGRPGTPPSTLPARRNARTGSCRPGAGGGSHGAQPWSPSFKMTTRTSARRSSGRCRRSLCRNDAVRPDVGAVPDVRAGGRGSARRTAARALPGARPHPGAGSDPVGGLRMMQADMEGVERFRSRLAR